MIALLTKQRDLLKRLTQLGTAVWANGLSAAVLLAFLFGFTQYIVDLERKQTYASFQDINNKIVLSDEIRIRSLLVSLDKVLLVLRDDLLANGGMTREALLRRLIAIKLEGELFPRVSIVDATGEVSLSSALTGAGEKVNFNVADRAYFQKQRASQEDLLDVGAPVQSRVTGKWVVPLSRRITNKDGSFGGILTLTIDPILLTEPFEKTSVGANAARALLGLDGYTLLRLNGDKVEYGGDSRKSQLYQEVKKKTGRLLHRNCRIRRGAPFCVLSRDQALFAHHFVGFRSCFHRKRVHRKNAELRGCSIPSRPSDRSSGRAFESRHLAPDEVG